MICNFSEVAYSTTERKRYSASHSLPISMTLVSCYGSEDKLIDCAYHDFTYTGDVATSMDVSVSCGSENDISPQPQSKSDTSRKTTDSISIAAIFCAVAVAVLVIVLVVLYLLRQKRKKSARRYISM